MEKGFIKISRKFFEHRYWNEPREFSRAEAWIDLIVSARFEAAIVLLNGRDVEVRRGELIASRRFLENRWKWSNTKVDNFLKMLEESQMLTRRNAKGNTILTLCNYDNYNYVNATENAKGTPQRRQLNAIGTPNNKKGKESKEGKEDCLCAESAPTDPQKQFFDSLIPFLGKYGKETLRAFYDYWSELNKSKTKMRWQMEKTWETERRIEYWVRRENEFKTKQANGANQQQAGVDNLKRSVLKRIENNINGVADYIESDVPL